MNFEQELLKAGYVYDPQPGSWFKEDSDGNVHTYMHILDNDWNYEKYDANDKVLESKAFTL